MILRVALGGVATQLPGGLVLDALRPVPSLLVVNLDDADPRMAQSASAAIDAWGGVAVGVASGPLGPAWDGLAGRLALTLLPDDAERANAPWLVGVADVGAAVGELVAGVEVSPVAARTLVELLQCTENVPVRVGLVAESLAYSTLLAGAEFPRWLGSHRPRPVPAVAEPAVLLTRADGRLQVELNCPGRHNAFNREVRDGLVEALELVARDTSIESLVIRGRGRSFCSGGDLDEFGRSEDLAVAHLIRIDRSVAARVHRVRERVTVQLHGACVGAGIEVASFAGHVVAAPDTAIRLPELAMGLVPGAGGTVGIARRIGRWRTAWLALSGASLPVPTALRWGLIDDLASDDCF